MDMYVERLRAVAQCVGWDFHHFTTRALHDAIERVESELGITADEMVKLSKRARAELGRKYMAVSRATPWKHS